MARVFPIHAPSRKRQHHLVRSAHPYSPALSVHQSSLLHGITRYLILLESPAGVRTTSLPLHDEMQDYRLGPRVIAS